MAVTLATRRLVMDRANSRCEYCGIPQEEFAAATSFVVEHIRPRSEFHDDDPMRDDPENLAWACPKCNSHKWKRTQAADPETEKICALFNPRTDRWEDHFLAHTSGHIIGITPKGRATRSTLNFDQPDRVLSRNILVERQRWP